MKALAASVAATCLGVFALWQATAGLQVVTAEGARRVHVALENPRIPDVELQTMSGQIEKFGADDGKIKVVEFIYTTCPTICQSAGADLARLRERVVKLGGADKVKLLSISFDPETDQVAQLSQYGKVHAADGAVWTIARPDKTDLQDLLKSFGIKVIPNEYGGYEHNVSLNVVDRNSRLVAIVDSDDIDGAFNEITKTLRQ